MHHLRFSSASSARPHRPLMSAARSAGEEETHHSHHCRCEELVINRFRYQSHITDWVQDWIKFNRTQVHENEIPGFIHVLQGVYTLKSNQMMLFYDVYDVLSFLILCRGRLDQNSGLAFVNLNRILR